MSDDDGAADSTGPLTNHFRVTRRSTGLDGTSLDMHNASVTGIVMPVTDAKIEREKQERKAYARKTLPRIQDWSCTYRQRLLPSTQASLKMFTRECRAYVRVDAVRGTAYAADENLRNEFRKICESVLSFVDKDLIFPGTLADAGAPNGVRLKGGPAAAKAEQEYNHFCDANGTAVRIILGAVKDPAINNQLSDLHDAHEVASGTARRARTAIMMLDLLRGLFSQKKHGGEGRPGIRRGWNRGRKRG